MRLHAFCLVAVLSLALWSGRAVQAQELGRAAADSLHQVLAQTTTDTARVAALNALAYALYTEAPDSTRRYATEALALAQEAEYAEGIARATMVQGIGLYATGAREEALRYFETARSQWSALDRMEEAAGVGANIGVILMQQGAYARALEVNLEAARVHAAVDSSRQLVSIYNNIGIIYGRLNDHDEALQYYEQALAAAQRVGDPALIAMAQANISSVLSDQGDHAAALERYAEALQIYEALEVTEHRIRIHGAMGEVHAERGDPAASLQAFEEALALSEAADRTPMPFVLRGLGLAHLRQGDVATAARYLQQAEPITARTGNPSEQEALDKAFYELHKAQGEPAQALERFEAHVALRDSIFSEERSERMAQLRTQYGMEQQALENEMLRAREADQEATIARQRLFVIGGVLFLLVLGGMSLLLYRTNRRLSGAIATLEDQNTVIQEQRDELEALNASKDELFAVIGHDLRGPVGNIKMLLDTLLDDEAPLDAEAKRDLLQMADETAGASVTLLENLLYWAQTQRGDLAATPTPTPCRRLIHRNMKLLRSEARSKKIHLSTVVDDTVVAQVDEKMADIVVRNLLANAIKFTPEGGQVTVRAVQETGAAVLTIEDSGVGMSPQQQHQLTDGEEQPGSSADTRGEKGTGLGLKLCRVLLARTAGTWHIDSTPGEGTTVHVRWPLAAPAPAPLEQQVA
ncbi:MAG: tetratricopeptide repeat protein [Bacteroidetes bacterium]|jgi:signal transduction histidine kinase|nr:tetratricopeptide repeat protein [Bacteroidota bacterium]